MGGRKITITVSEEQYKALSEFAEESGLGRVSTLLKSEAVKSVQDRGIPHGDRKRIVVDVTNYHELAGYVEQKHFGSISSFCTFAMESVMQRNQLTDAQKARIGKNIE